MRNWLPLAQQIAFGWDTNIALCSFVALSFLFGEGANPWFLCIAGIAAYLPDLDLIPFLLLRKKMRIAGHWVFGHYPIIILPLEVTTVGIIALTTCRHHALFLISLVLVCTIAHFVHDAAARSHGFHLLAPFTRDGQLRFTLASPTDLWVHYTVSWTGVKEAPKEDVQRLYETSLQRAQTYDNYSEIMSRVEAVSLSQVTTFGLGTLGLVALVICNGSGPGCN